MSSGDELSRLIIEMTGLQPTGQVLEVGCGVGRIARPLTRYIRPPGTWSGFDIVPRAISWCQKHITSRHPNFSFQHADVFNAKYNPRGSLAAHEFAFPYPDGTFDLVYLTSVFTHMLPPDVGHYTREIARVLRPGGKAFLTYFILGAETPARLARGEATMSFDVALDGARAMHAGSPEAAVAFGEHDVRTMLQDVNLVVREPILWGTWSGATDGPTFQDVVLAEKPSH